MKIFAAIDEKDKKSERLVKGEIDNESEDEM